MMKILLVVVLWVSVPMTIAFSEESYEERIARTEREMSAQRGHGFGMFVGQVDFSDILGNFDGVREDVDPGNQVGVFYRQSRPGYYGFGEVSYTYSRGDVDYRGVTRSAKADFDMQALRLGWGFMSVGYDQAFGTNSYHVAVHDNPPFPFPRGARFHLYTGIGVAQYKLRIGGNGFDGVIFDYPAQTLREREDFLVDFGLGYMVPFGPRYLIETMVQYGYLFDLDSEYLMWTVGVGF